MLLHLLLQAGIGLRQIGRAISNALFEAALRGAQLLFDQPPFMNFIGNLLVEPLHDFRPCRQ